MRCFQQMISRWLKLPAFFKFFRSSRQRARPPDNFFPAEYEFLSLFFPAHSAFPKFHVRGLEISLGAVFSLC